MQKIHYRMKRKMGKATWQISVIGRGQLSAVHESPLS
jgi:hypothetical protein